MSDKLEEATPHPHKKTLANARPLLWLITAAEGNIIYEIRFTITKHDKPARGKTDR